MISKIKLDFFPQELLWEFLGPLNKIEYMCFNQREHISSLNSGSLKLVDKFPFLSDSVSSTKNDINMCLTKHCGSLTYPVK